MFCGPKNTKMSTSYVQTETKKQAVQTRGTVCKVSSSKCNVSLLKTYRIELSFRITADMYLNLRV
jgi:hypothetical protein